MVDFSHIVGQEQAKRAIQDWYKYEQQPLLIYGSSGFGKTKFAESLGARTVDTTQFRSDRVNSILKPIKEADDGDILFFDEIHSLQPKVLEGLYRMIDRGTFYDTELCMDLPIPRVKFIFATNILDPLPTAFVNRCRFVELQEYSPEELGEIVHLANPALEGEAVQAIVRASKGVPRTALSLAKSVVAGAKTEEIRALDQENVNILLASRFSIDGSTGLSSKEHKIIAKVVERGHLSTTAVANLLKCSVKDAKMLYIEPLRADSWLAINSQGIIPGFKAHENYKIFMRKEK